MLRKILFFILFVEFICYAQTNNNLNNNVLNENNSIIAKTDLSTSLNISTTALQSPLHFDSNDLMITGSIFALTSLSFSFDNSIRNKVRSGNTKSLKYLINIGEKIGDPIYGSVISGFLYTYGLYSSDNYIKATGQMLAEAMIVNGLYTLGLKLIFGRDRPYAGDGNNDFDFFAFEFEAEDSSFPSGHTSTAFTIATVLSERIDNIYASVALYSLSSLTAYQRMYSDVHWFSDTIIGAALGTFIGLKIVKLHEEDSDNEDNYNLNISPLVAPNNYGVNFSLQF